MLQREHEVCVGDAEGRELGLGKGIGVRAEKVDDGGRGGVFGEVEAIEYDRFAARCSKE